MPDPERTPDPEWTPEPTVDGPDDWHRLSPAMMAVKPVQQIPQLIPVIIAIFFAGQGAPLLSLGLGLIAVIAVTLVPWLTTSYQVTADHVRVRSGLITKKVATARRDRIRSVDLSASAPHRILGLKKVTVGTGGDKGSSTVTLDAVAAPYADTLHDFLMPTRRTIGAVSNSGTDDLLTGEPVTGDDAPALPTPTPEQPPQILARFRPGWLRFAPFSLTGLAAAAAVGGLSMQIANDAGLFDHLADTGTAIARHFEGLSITMLVVGLLVGIIVVGGLLSLVAYVLSYWDFTIARHADGTLRISRGLISTNSTNLDENRIRGVHLHEPVLMRPVHGARLFAIATGSSKHPMLLPPAPVDEAVAVAAAVTAADTYAGSDTEADTSTDTDLTAPLIPHGSAARRRRWTRGVVVGVGVGVVPIAIAISGHLRWPLAIALAAAILGVSLGAAELRYRHLGHRLSSRVMTIGSPQIARHRFLVERDGVVGWATRTSFFQRRRGITTLTLATAAGSEAYPIVDVPTPVAADLMAEVSGDFVRPFLISADG